MLNLTFADCPNPKRIHQAVERAAQIARGLVEDYELHKEPTGEPVNISNLLINFDLRFLDLPASTHGFTVDMGHAGIIIAINDKLDTAQTRFVAAHEIGHTALWHPNQLNACIKGQWLYDQLEVEASAVAAFLLVPGQIVCGGLLDQFGKSRVESLAKQYAVPTELILIRRALYAQLGY